MVVKNQLHSSSDVHTGRAGHRNKGDFFHFRKKCALDSDPVGFTDFGLPAVQSGCLAMVVLSRMSSLGCPVPVPAYCSLPALGSGLCTRMDDLSW
jgi:hypothetical protein